ncbi:Rib/alpha-like domain-containing protein, partial [Anaerococcus porci]|uniref:Rib/alpha-like domain-containing protein n=1 Tax=Anaerococcus porci TaxID=2652269 RepID=UPI002A766CAC
KDSQPAGELNTSKENVPQAETASEEVVKKQAGSFNASIKDIIVKENQEINYKDAVENLPQDAKLEVLTPAKTDSIGESIAKAKIVFSDKSEKEIEIKVTVEANDELSDKNQATEATTEATGSNVAKRRVPRAASMAANDTEVREANTSEDANNAVHGIVGIQTVGDVNMDMNNPANKDYYIPAPGVDVYFQWIEEVTNDVSPVYKATSGADGKFHIAADPYMTSSGKLIQFDADTTVSAGRERYRFWVDPKTLPEKYQLAWTTGEGVIFPNFDLPYTGGGAGNDTAKNQLTGFKVLLKEKEDPIMHKDNPTQTPPKVTGLAEGGNIEGKVAWDWKSGVGGIQYSTIQDATIPAKGVNVVASYLSDYAMKRIFSPETARDLGVASEKDIRGANWTINNEKDLQDWIKDKIKKEGKDLWIAETVEATTNAEGNYIIQFNGIWGPKSNRDAATYTREANKYNWGDVHTWTDEEASRLGKVADDAKDGSFADGAFDWNEKHINYDFVFVSLKDTDDSSVLTPYNYNQYAAHNDTWGIHSGWGTGTFKSVVYPLNKSLNEGFTLRSAYINFEIVDYNSTTNLASPGTQVETKTTGLPYKNSADTQYRIAWYDENGKEITKNKLVEKSGANGTISSHPHTSDLNLSEAKTYTAKLIQVNPDGKDGNVIAVDSYTVVPNSPIGSVNEEYTWKAIEESNDVTYNVSGLPKGLEYKKGGVVSGKPEPGQAGVYDVAFEATKVDEAGDIKSSIHRKLIVTDAPLPQGTVGTDYNQEVKITGLPEDGSYKYEIVNVELDNTLSGLSALKEGDVFKITGKPEAINTADEDNTNVKVTSNIYEFVGGIWKLVEENHVDNVPLKVTKKLDAEIINQNQTVPENTPIEDISIIPDDYNADVDIDTSRFPEGISAPNPKNPYQFSGTPVINDWAKGETKRVFTIPVTINNSDGSVINKDITITVLRDQKPADQATSYEPSYEQTPAKVGEKATVAAPKFLDSNSETDPKPEANPQPTGMKFALDTGAPEGAVIDKDTGAITYTPSEKDAGKEISIPVKVTYSDDTTDTATAKIKVAETTADAIIPYLPSEEEPTKGSDGKDIPESYIAVTFEAEAGKGTVKVGEKTGDLVYAKVKPGTDLTGKAEAIPAEGYGFTKWNPELGVAQADNTYVAKFIKSGDEIGKDDSIPKGWSKVTVKQDDTIQAGTVAEKYYAVAPKGKLTTEAFPDLTGKEVKGYEKPAWYVGEEKVENPAEKEITGDTTFIAKATEIGENIIPVNPEDPNREGYARVTLESGKNIANITGTQAYDVKNDGTVKYSDLINEITKDGSKTIINVDPITGRNSLEWSVDGKEVVPTEYLTKDTTLKVSAKDAYAPKGTEQTVQKGAVVDAKDSIANKDTLPEGTTYEFVDDKGDPITPDTNSIGEKDVNVKVTYPNPTENGGPTIVKTKINVIEEKTEAEKNPAVAPEKTTVENKEKLTPEEKQEVEAKVKKANPEATKVEVKDDGNATLTYKDNSTNTLTPEQTIVERVKTTVEGEPTKVNPTDEEQKTGLTVKNQDETTPTTVTAKDEDGTEIPVKVDPETGEIKVTPGTNVDGPITVTIQDDDFKTEDNPKGEITKEVPVTGHTKGVDDNRTKTTVEGEPTKVNPTDEEQKTGLTVKNQDETTPTTVTAKDEDGTEIPVTIDSKTGEIKVTPGTNVDGPITVTIKDEDFKTDENPEGIITKEVPVKGHTKGVDDNGSDKTQADTTNPLTPEKTPVVNKEDLTEEEKAEVKKKIEDANKDVFPQAKEGQEATKVEIGKDGAATITYPDKSQDTIKGEDLVREKTKLTGTPVVVNP